MHSIAQTVETITLDMRLQASREWLVEVGRCPNTVDYDDSLCIKQTDVYNFHLEF